MPFALVFVGMLLVISGFQNSYSALGQQVEKDFSGSGNFIYWLVALGVVGSIGYVSQFSTASRYFMVLIILVMILKNDSGFFAQFQKQLSSGTSTSAGATVIGAPLPFSGGSGNVSGSSGSSGSSTSSILGDVKTGASIVSAIGSLF